jgi:VWFA-related protein
MPFQPKAWAAATLAFAVVAVIAGTEAGATRGAGATREAGATPKARATRTARLSGFGVSTPEGQGVVPPLRLDIAVRDSQGKPVSDLEAGQFTVTVDGAPRRVISARYVFRGPGSEASARGAGRAASPEAAPLFDPSRAILVVVDETSFPRGGEKAVAAATDRLLDRFGPADQVALVTAPMPEDALSVSFADDRATIRETLTRLQGRSVAVDIMARADEAPIAPVVDPDAAAAAAGTSTTGGEAPPVRVPEEPRKDQIGDDRALPGPNERREHGLETLTRLIAGLRVAPGPKTVVFATAGLPEMDRATTTAVRGFLQNAETEAVRARATIYVLGLPNAGQPVSWTELEQLSTATGGELVRVGRNADQALDRIGLALSSLYCLEVEGAATDRDPRGRAIKVTVSRAGVAVRAARRLVVRTDPTYHAVSPAPAAGAPVGARDLPDAAPAPAVRTAGRGRRGNPDPEFEALVARASEYLSGYFREFKNVVAEEEYTQMNMAVRPAEIRRTKSDFLLAMAPDGKSLVPFRDVFEVDGRPVRDREDRLKKLFLEAPSNAFVDAATRVQNEGARYNLVSTRTTANVPTFPLGFLLEPSIRGFEFRRGREETVENVRVVRVDYEEVGTPTAIYAASTGTDIPSSGSIWVDPLTGRVLKTYLRAADAKISLSLEATVTYKRSDVLGLWVPSEMRETYRLRGYSIEGRAFYSNFRSFQVKTQQEIKVEKK